MSTRWSHCPPRTQAWDGKKLAAVHAAKLQDTEIFLLYVHVVNPQPGEAAMLTLLGRGRQRTLDTLRAVGFPKGKVGTLVHTAAVLGCAVYEVAALHSYDRNGYAAAHGWEAVSRLEAECALDPDMEPSVPEALMERDYERLLMRVAN